MLEQVNQSTSL